MTIKEFLRDINGMDIDTRKAKSAATFQLQTLHIPTGKSRIVESLSIHKPIIEARRRGDYMEISFMFNDDKDINLKRIWNMYQEYGRLINNLAPEAINVPQMLTMIVPVKENGKKFIYAYEPIFWAPKPKAPGLKNTMFSVLFEVSTISFVDNMELDTKEIMAEAEREIKAELDIRAKDLDNQ